jgi:hypothetical protein
MGNDITSDIGLADDLDFNSDDFNFDFDDSDEAEGMRKAGTTRHSESYDQECVQPSESATTKPDKTPGLAIISPGSYIVANQLQFVNRQLGIETRSIALRYNNITFAESGLRQSSELCTNFVQTLSTKQESHVKDLGCEAHWRMF